MIFNLKRKWFDMIARGDKTIEYREVKPYWTTRLKKLVPFISRITFRLGYSPGNDINARFIGYDTGKCPYEGWNGTYYRIHFDVIRKSKGNS